MPDERRRSRTPAQTCRTPLLSSLRRLMGLASCADRPGSAPVDELAERAREQAVSRREWLKTSGVLLAGHRPVRKKPERPKRSPLADARGPRIAIVGAGLAGLRAAHVLKQAGIRARLFTAEERLGGRVSSMRDLLAPGLTAELGGEFIDSGHEEILSLVKEFGLELLDLDRETLPEAYYFGGEFLGERQLIAAFRPLVARIRADLHGLPASVSAFAPHPGYVRLDRMSIAEYLRSAEVSGLAADLIRSAYLAEDGLELERQSALNLVTQIGTNLRRGLELYGASDERYKVRDGNQRIVERLAAEVIDQVEWNQRLAAIRSRGAGFVLSFQSASAPSVEVTADLVILAVPFTLLRQVELNVPLPAIKRRAINELAYGTNTKLLLGMSERVWRSQGFNGEAYSDEPFAVCFDNAALQTGAGTAGGTTVYLGGDAAVAAGRGSAYDQARSVLPGLERVFPRVTARFNGKAARAYWPGDPFVQASYSTYSVGQTTSIGGTQGPPAGNLFFAGEHCDHPDLGYMNGAAKTGRLAAQGAIARLGAPGVVNGRG